MGTFLPYICIQMLDLCPFYVAHHCNIYQLIFAWPQALPWAHSRALSKGTTGLFIKLFQKSKIRVPLVAISPNTPFFLTCYMVPGEALASPTSTIKAISESDMLLISTSIWLYSHCTVACYAVFY